MKKDNSLRQILNKQKQNYSKHLIIAKKEFIYNKIETQEIFVKLVVELSIMKQKANQSILKKLNWLVIPMIILSMC